MRLGYILYAKTNVILSLLELDINIRAVSGILPLIIVACIHEAGSRYEGARVTQPLTHSVEVRRRCKHVEELRDVRF